MAPGVLWVASRVVNPDKLSAEKFCDWYENEHIQEVISLGGVPSGVRYQAIQPQPSPSVYSNEFPWLVTYEFPDLAYRESEDFQNIAGKNPPSQELINTVYKNSAFAIRFYEEIQAVKGTTSSPTKFVISAALQPPKDASSDADFDAWYREEHLPVLSRAPGFVRSRRFKLAAASTLEDFQFGDAMETAPRYLALHEFSGEVLPWKELEASGQTEWAKKVMGGLIKEEVGLYEVKRVYSETEWGSVGK
ncbi:uncharacterized protein J4E78_000314 [Alternaria triticimaculans]|uniref:uncharacterized protein n=1 Tax=Alternaria triticimaculans TaxID=297637 RepID=UPI0020C2F2D6|nr:uncharacterized protein J4E78_000314 [Alternaria triticimaculans]KAI4671817.1 hypothetical protein J4E78_000314 [Alternaria triticimaculans]